MNPAVAFGTSQASLIAATVRYAYVVPAEAKGKNISFTFSSTSSTGAKASYSTPSYPVSKMDMKRLIELGNEGACYFSIEDMKAYTKEEVTTQSLASKIDFIYIHSYRQVPTRNTLLLQELFLPEPPIRPLWKNVPMYVTHS